MRRFPGCDAVLYGHTHLPEVERHGGVWILNPGSPTERRRAPAHTMLVLEIEAGEIRPELVVVEADPGLTRTGVRSSMANTCS